MWCPCFFFQAEDGIRDFHVTGVQTCALPISTGEITGFASSGSPPPHFSPVLHEGFTSAIPSSFKISLAFTSIIRIFVIEAVLLVCGKIIQRQPKLHN